MDKTVVIESIIHQKDFWELFTLYLSCQLSTQNSVHHSLSIDETKWKTELPPHPSTGGNDSASSDKNISANDFRSDPQYERCIREFAHKFRDAKLTPAELTVAALIVMDYQYEAIAEMLGCELQTVANHSHDIRKKLGLTKEQNLHSALLG